MTALEKWAREVYGKSAAKPGALRKALFQTSSGIEVKPLYSPDEAPPSIGYPGQYPFTRGIQPTMYRGRFWTMRQYAGFGSAEQTNERFHYLLESGQTGLSTAFDLPTQMGHDSDSPRARGEVGRVGVAIDSVDDVERLFRGIDLGKVSTSMTINATAATLLALYQAVGEAHGTRAADLSGTIQNDILKEYMARGTYVYPPGPSMRLITDTFEYASKVVGRLSFFFNVHNNFLEEVAKFRAARRLWARTMKERFKAKDPRSCTLRFHAQTAGSTLTAQQADNNVVRVAIQALAAVLGGCQSLHTNSRDEALSLPTETSARIALRTQQIVAHETGVCDFIDGLGGSWALEALTDELEAKAVDYLRRIDEMGGMVEAISRQFPQREIEDAAYAAQKEVEEKKQIVVGVNEFVSSVEAPMDMLRIDPKLEEQQIARVKAFRRQRDNSSATRALSELKKAAEGSENVVPKIVSAVKARATLGEVANAMREVFGEHTK